VYAGTIPEHPVRQNALPNPLGATWVQPAVLVTEGKRPGPGQSPNTLHRVARRISRG